MQWLAYDKCHDEKERVRLLNELSLEKQKNCTAEQEASNVLQFFKGLGLK